jgi:methionyl-tRNA formyltransferase
MRIVFMGTPDFAVESLRALVEGGKNVVAVITAPDKPAGRGQKIHETAVKKYAVSMGIPVLQPPKLKNPDFLAELASYEADLQVVVAFRMLPEVVWSMPTKGTFNLHGSLLPQYRGAAPINWAIINGEKETGVTTFLIEKEIDTGKIIFSEKIAIDANENAGTIHDKLMVLGGELVLKTANAIEKGEYPQVNQDDSQVLKSAPKIFKEDCEINWNKSAEEIHNFIRGMSPYPTAWTTLVEKTLKVFESEIAESFEINNEKTDGVSSDSKTYLQFKCKDGAINILELQLEGKRRMNVKDFLAGYRF